jgi:tetratricopeptide (TPR) repeat protein
MAYFRLGDLYAKHGKLRDAAAMNEKYLKTDHGNAEVLAKLAGNYYDLSWCDLRLTYSAEALRIKPSALVGLAAGRGHRTEPQ